MTADFITSVLMAPYLSSLAAEIQLAGASAPSDKKLHVLVTGALSECPYVSRFLSQVVEDAGLEKKIEILPVMNGYVVVFAGDQTIN